MEYLCILNAFEQNYYNRIKEIEQLVTATAVSQQPTSASSSSASSACSSSSSSASVSISASGSASSSSTASSTASSPTAVAKEAAAVAAAAAAAAAVSSSRHFPASFAHAAALAATQQQLQQRLAAAAYQQQQQQQQGHAEFPAQSPLFYQHQKQQQQQQQQHFHQQHQQQQQQHHQLPGAAYQQGLATATSQLQQNNSNMANSLLWQPWRDLQQAAAMHHQLIKQQQQQQQHQHQQHLHKETRLTSKELPTTKWRRERRQRAAAAEYQVHDAGSGAAAAGGVGGAAGAGAERERERTPDLDSPIDMSVTSSTLKHQRASPPPPYREPLTAASAHCYAASRPSVITQAPPKREPQEQLHQVHANRELDNRSADSVSMCDIDEHFRRSLGPDYAALLKSPTPSSPTPSPQPQLQSQPLPVAGNGIPMQQISPHGAYRQQQQHHSPLSLPLPLSKMGLPSVHSPTLHSAPVSPQLELPPPQEEPLSLSSSPVRTASTLPPSPPPLAAAAVAAAAGVSQLLELPVSRRERERALDTPHHTPPRYNTPPPAYGSVLTSTPTPPTMPAIIRVKAEPGLATASSTPHTPPASPTSSTNISIFTKTEASVDDHFAKALGDTWKKLQANKE